MGNMETEAQGASMASPGFSCLHAESPGHPVCSSFGFGLTRNSQKKTEQAFAHFFVSSPWAPATWIVQSQAL